MSLSSNTAHSPEPSGRTVTAEALDVLNTGLDGLRALVLRARAALGVGPPVTSIYKQFVNLRAAADAVLWRSLSEHRWSRDETFEEAVAALLQEGYASDPEISDPPPLTSGQLVKLCSARSCLCAAEAGESHTELREDATCSPALFLSQSWR